MWEQEMDVAGWPVAARMGVEDWVVASVVAVTTEAATAEAVVVAKVASEAVPMVGTEVGVVGNLRHSDKCHRRQGLEATPR